MSQKRFQYRAIGTDGAAISDVLVADSRAEALRRLAKERKTVLELKEAGAGASLSFKPRVTSEESVLILQQLAVMTGAGVELLEALHIIAASLAGRPAADNLQATIVQLRQGERLAKALQEAAPFYPTYVYALISAGEASGRLGLVLNEAARQLEFEQRVARDVRSALAYPAFLVFSGMASVAFLFYAVVPRFAIMLQNARANLSGFSAWIINSGVAFHDHAALFAIGFAALIVAIISFAVTRDGRQFFARLGHATPFLNKLLTTRERAAWSRIMALALAAGVDVLEAASLAGGALPPGKLKDSAQSAIPALRAGRPVDEAFLKSDALSAVDASLVRAGQRSGALAEMFKAVADRNDEATRTALKRFTVFVEPVAIALVAGFIGSIVLGLVTALASIYDSIG